MKQLHFHYHCLYCIVCKAVIHWRKNRGEGGWGGGCGRLSPEKKHTLNISSLEKSAPPPPHLKHLLTPLNYLEGMHVAQFFYYAW